MSRVDIVDQLYRRMYNNKTVEFDQIQAPAPLAYFFTPTDIGDLHYIASSNKLAAKVDLKYKYIREIMTRRGFKKLASGTNRVVYKFMEDQRIVVKTAFDTVGLTDSPSEFYNQQFLKPYCTKVFEVTPCGTVGLFERVHPISSKEEFLSVADDIYDIIINHLIGYYVLDDIGTKSYMNWAVRAGAHPVLCDFPYMFQVDGAKLICNKADPFSQYGFCGGEIDYDDGFNHLVCKKCGKHYLARDLQKAADGLDNGILITDKKGDIRMKVTVVKGEKTIQTIDTEKSSSTYRRPAKSDKRKNVPYKTPYERREEKRIPIFNVTSTTSGIIETPDIVEEKPVVEVKMNVTETKKTQESVQPKITPHVSTGKSIKDFVEDNSKYNQKTSISDQPIVEAIASKVTPAETEEVSDNDVEIISENEDIDMQTEQSIDTVIEHILNKVSGNEDGYVVDSKEVVDTIIPPEDEDRDEEEDIPEEEAEVVEDQEEDDTLGEY